uniref:Uncharacterized protein n=1 Tax=Anguilla anguilla TaxID=7936 RepID=A0A0E9TA00_ANGAN
MAFQTLCTESYLHCCLLGSYKIA